MTRLINIIVLFLILSVALVGCDNEYIYPKVDPSSVDSCHSVGDVWNANMHWNADKYNNWNGYSCVMEYQLLEFGSDYFVLSISCVEYESEKPEELDIYLDITDFNKVESMTEYELPNWQDETTVYIAFSKRYINISDISEKIVLKFYFEHPINLDRFVPHIEISNMRAGRFFGPDILICPEIYVKEIEN